MTEKTVHRGLFFSFDREKGPPWTVSSFDREKGPPWTVFSFDREKGPPWTVFSFDRENKDFAQYLENLVDSILTAQKYNKIAEVVMRTESDEKVLEMNLL